MVSLRHLIIGLLGLLTLWAGPSAIAEPLKNVIVMISDGCGYNQIRAAALWQGTPLPFENFPIRLGMSTYSWNTLQGDPAGYDPNQAWANFLYVMLRPTDSASAATAMSTGVKADDGSLGVDPIDGHALLNVTQRAKQLGKSTGVITSVEWSHATPAGFVAHDLYRGNYAEIAREMIDSSGCDVIMGCGHPSFNHNGIYSAPVGEESYQFVGGSETWNRLVAGTAGTPEPWTLLQTRAQFQALMTGPTPPRVCGTAQCAATLQQARTPGESGNNPITPFTIPQNTTVPTLSEMTRGALNVLDNNPNGFFLMIEGGAIDWCCHSNQQGREIEEELGFADAAAAVIAWVEAHSNWNETLVIVTGDHETGYLWGPNSGSNPPRWNPLVDHGANHMPGEWFNSGSHTNSLIPFFAKGAGSEWFTRFATHRDPQRGPYIDNTDIAHVIFGHYDDILAVELHIFDANSGGDGVLINWSTASERDNDRFELSRDQHFLTAVPSQGNTSVGHHYAWTDRDVQEGREYAYTLTSVDTEGKRKELGQRTVTYSRQPATVLDLNLLQNYPNPFNAITQIGFDLPQSMPVKLDIFNAAGQRVEELWNGTRPAGHNVIRFDGGKLPSGLYVYSLIAGNREARKKMLLLK
jgi:alkaline phosphatase